MREIAAILLVAIAVSLPILLGPVRTNDSHWINIVWADQFTAEMARGTVWPRWLPASHDGLGAPVFYFYGPMAFWIAGLAGIAGAAVWTSLTLTACAALCASGVAMHVYLNGRAARPLTGALAYMLAPYHLLDFAQRGALAEFVAFAWLPIIGSGVGRAARRRPALLIVAYAGLILTHLPTAVLTSCFLLPLLAANEIRRDRTAWVGIAAGLIGGVALAAAYLLPALTLQGWTAMETMHNRGVYQPANWSIASIRPDEAPGLLLIHGISVAAILLALSASWQARGTAWRLHAIAMALLALGALPPLWHLPVLDQVQFPWRILVIADFGLAMIVGHHVGSERRLMVGAVPLTALSLFVIALPAANVGAAEAALIRRHPDVLEYLPHGVGEPIGFYSPWALALARRMPAETYDGRYTTLRRFAFPTWRVRCAGHVVPSAPAPETALLRYRGAGCAIERTILPVERIGNAISYGMLLLLALLAIRRFMPGRSSPGSTTLRSPWHPARAAASDDVARDGRTR